MILNVLSSGSHGNCFVIDNDRHQLIVECGINIKKIKRALDFDLNSVGGCLITHEHGDHASAAWDIVNSGIDIYASEGTLKGLRLNSNHRTHAVKPLEIFNVATYKVFPFDVHHDSKEPMGFVIYDTISRQRLLFVTDTHMLKYQFKNIDHYVVECNYDEETLEANLTSNYLEPSRYSRVKDTHMGLETLIKALKSHGGSPKTITLIHLSDTNSNWGNITKRIVQEFGIVPNVAESDQILELF